MMKIIINIKRKDTTNEQAIRLIEVDNLNERVINVLKQNGKHQEIINWKGDTVYTIDVKD